VIGKGRVLPIGGNVFGVSFRRGEMREIPLLE